MKISRMSQKIKEYAAMHRQKKKWLMAVICLAAVAVFCTIDMLILPALTLEADQTLACPYEMHRHNDSCLDEDGTITCGYADYVVHAHDSKHCYDKDGDFVCQLSELETHEHDSACYEEQPVLVCEEIESSGHRHDESCYTSIQRELTCAITEEDHIHSDNCYTWEDVLTCEMEEGDGAHQHGETCYETKTVLTCDQQEVILHTHCEDCYTDILDDDGEVVGQTLICGLLQVEEHQHNAGCLAAAEAVEKDRKDAELTGEEQAQADEVIARIEALPSYEELSNLLTAYNETADHESDNAHLEEIQRQVSDVYAAYSAMTEEQQAAVTNTDKLMDLVRALHLSGMMPEGVETDDNGAVLAYISGFSISGVIDGSEPFDTTGKLVNGSVDTPGNDDWFNNRVVRSFDSIEYDMEFRIATRDSDITLNSAQIGFELSLYKGATAAEFNTKDMSWLEEGWLIEYLDAQGRVILVKDGTGLYEWDAENHRKGEKTSLNDFVNGSNNSGGNAYMGNNGIVQQKLTGTYTIKKGSEDIASAVQSLTAFINVLAASNGETFEPSFQIWIVGNEENLDADGQASSANEIKIDRNSETTGQYVVTVSAAARYNVLIKNSSATNHLGYFDFSTGQKAESAGDAAAYGRMLSWGITLQLYNETDSTVPGAIVSKGYRGIELPINGISFDLILTSSVKSENNGSELTGDYHFSPYLWDYHANDTANAGAWGRNLYWGNNDRTRYAKSVAPYNNSGAKVPSYGTKTNFCYNGGAWMLTGYTVDGSSKSGATKTDLSSTSGTGSGTVYRFSVSGYDFDFDDFLSQFPLSASGDSGTSSFLSAPAYSFSAGHIQVFQRFDETYRGAFTAYVNAEVRNLQTQSKTDQNAREMKTTDNADKLSVVQYSPGSYAKYISLTDREANDSASGANKFNFTSSAYFLGGSNLETRNDDASAYAGSDIYMFSRGYRTSGDGYINAINFLQKFDSKVLSIDTSVTDAKLDSRYGAADEKQPWFAWYVGFANSDVNAEGKNPGTAIWLYAADPLWPEGYDTNDAGRRSFAKAGVTYDYTAAQRMAFAQEEDLIYFESLDALKRAGYTCIGVLMEVRNCSLEAGSNYPTLRVAMKVSPDAANIGRTVSTTAIIRNWLDDGGSMSGISWKNGTANQTPVATGGKPVANTLNDGAGGALTDLTAYGTCVALTPGSGPAADMLYVKSEYDNGNIVTGTHYNGYTWGMSMLVVGYKSYLDIDVKNVKDVNAGESGGAGNLVFEIDKGEWTAEYTLSNIHTEATEETPQSSTTNLKLTVTVPTESSVGADDGLTMVTSSFKIATTDDEGNPTYTGIGEDHETEFKFTYGGEEYTCKVSVAFDSEGQASLYLRGVPICATLPNIVFEAEIGSKVSNNADLTVSAAISGDQDSRAQTADNGNYVTETIRISTLSSSSLVKEVEEALTELDGEIHYTIAYSNTSTQSAIEKMYLYDLMPYNGDIRSSSFDGNVRATGISAYLSDSSGNTSGVTFTAYARFYYSTVRPEILKRILGQKDFDNMPETDGIYLQALLDNALVDDEGNVYFFLRDGKICDLYQYGGEGKDEKIISTNFTVDSGTRRVETVNIQYSKFVRVSGVTADGAGGITLAAADAAFQPDTYKKMFRHYGYIDGTSTSSTITPGVGADEAEEFDSATCIFARVINLSAARTLNIEITMDTNENAAGNTYGNKAHSTIVGNTASQLSSNIVKTRVVSREISGLVWWDENQNGAYDDGETLLSGVDCTLFRQAANGNWEKCTADVTGAEIHSVTTGTDGAYAFAGLAEGTYVVAFKNAANSTTLDKFIGATSYQVSSAGADTNSDGQIVTGSQTGLNGYAYFICDSVSSEGVSLSALDTIAQSAAFRTGSYKEIYDHLDLGLVTADLSIDKVSESGGYLTGAAFLLYQEDFNGTKSYYSYDPETDTTTWVADENAAEVLATGTAGSYQAPAVHWLTAGTYYLLETSAPDGYDPLTEPVEITASTDGSVTVKYEGVTYGSRTKNSWKVAFEEITEGNYAWGISVPNRSGYELPETGGDGTILYTTGGLLLITASILLLYSNPKRRKEDFASS